MLFLNLHHHNQVNLLFSFTHHHTHSHKLLSPSPWDILLSLFVPLRPHRQGHKGQNRRRWWGLFGAELGKKNLSPIHQHNVERTWGNPIERFPFLLCTPPSFVASSSCSSYNHGIDGEKNVIQNLSRVESESWVESREKSKNSVNISERDLCEKNKAKKRFRHGRNYENSFRLINVSSNPR